MNRYLDEFRRASTWLRGSKSCRPTNLELAEAMAKNMRFPPRLGERDETQTEAQLRRNRMRLKERGLAATEHLDHPESFSLIKGGLPK